MNILVCIKQVPDTSEIELDYDTGTLKRGEAGSQINPYDLYALEAALRIKEAKGGKISVINLGEIKARQIIREAYMMGIDEGYLVSDRHFTGSDVYTTALILSKVISKNIKPDIIICGKKSTDSGTAHLGSSLAELLDIPHVSDVKKILEVNENSLLIEMDMGDSTVKASLKLPCLINVDEDINEPRLLSFRKKLETEKNEIKLLKLEDLDLDLDKENNYGLKGSPTHIKKVYPAKDSSENISITKEAKKEISTLKLKRLFPEGVAENKEILTGSGRDLAEGIYERLKELKHV